MSEVKAILSTKEALLKPFPEERYALGSFSLEDGSDWEDCLSHKSVSKDNLNDLIKLINDLDETRHVQVMTLLLENEPPIATMKKDGKVRIDWDCFDETTYEALAELVAFIGVNHEEGEMASVTSPSSYTQLKKTVIFGKEERRGQTDKDNMAPANNESGKQANCEKFDSSSNVSDDEETQIEAFEKDEVELKSPRIKSKRRLRNNRTPGKEEFQGMPGAILEIPKQEAKPPNPENPSRRPRGRPPSNKTGVVPEEKEGLPNSTYIITEGSEEADIKRQKHDAMLQSVDNPSKMLRVRPFNVKTDVESEEKAGLQEKPDVNSEFPEETLLKTRQNGKKLRGKLQSNMTDVVSEEKVGLPNLTFVIQEGGEEAALKAQKQGTMSQSLEIHGKRLRGRPLNNKTDVLSEEKEDLQEGAEETVLKTRQNAKRPRGRLLNQTYVASEEKEEFQENPDKVSEANEDAQLKAQKHGTKHQPSRGRPFNVQKDEASEEKEEVKDKPDPNLKENEDILIKTQRPRGKPLNNTTEKKEEFQENPDLIPEGEEETLAQIIDQDIKSPGVENYNKRLRGRLQSKADVSEEKKQPQDDTNVQTLGNLNKKSRGRPRKAVTLSEDGEEIEPRTPEASEEMEEIQTEPTRNKSTEQLPSVGNYAGRLRERPLKNKLKDASTEEKETIQNQTYIVPERKPRTQNKTVVNTKDETPNSSKRTRAQTRTHISDVTEGKVQSDPKKTAASKEKANARNKPQKDAESLPTPDTPSKKSRGPPRKNKSGNILDDIEEAKNQGHPGPRSPIRNSKRAKVPQLKNKPVVTPEEGAKIRAKSGALESIGKRQRGRLPTM